jgi:hypothetical protein
MSEQETTIQHSGAQAQTVHESAMQEPVAAETSFADDEWVEQADEELPRRPRRRLLAPIPLALLGVLLIACGFIGGVLVEKGQSGSGASGAGAGGTGLAARFAALRGGAAGAGATGGASGAGASSGSSSAAGGGFFGRSGGAAGTGGGGGATTGQVAYLAGSTLYVTTAEGNTVKVTTSPAATVTKTVKASVQGIHPGETVIVTGTTDAKGVLSAESIRVGTSAGGGGLGALFGGGTGSGGRSGGAVSGATTGNSGPALFGNGG